QRRARAHALHERRHLALRLDPDLLAERVVARDAVVVLELVGPVRARLAREHARALDHVENELLRRLTAFARNERQLGAEGGHLVELLAAESVGGDDPDPVTTGGADERERGARAAAGVLDDGVA